MKILGMNFTFIGDLQLEAKYQTRVINYTRKLSISRMLRNIKNCSGNIESALDIFMLQEILNFHKE